MRDLVVFVVLLGIVGPYLYPQGPAAEQARAATGSAVVAPARSAGRTSSRPSATAAAKPAAGKEGEATESELPAKRSEAATSLTAARERVQRLATRIAPASEKLLHALPVAIVAHAVDGDTLRLSDGRVVRLLQVDTPEKYGQAECYGEAASAVANRLLKPGTRVRLIADPTLDDKDRYGRLLRYVIIIGPGEDRDMNMNVNLEVVRAGAAAPYFYRGAHGLLSWSLDLEARAARGAARGLWGSCPETRYDPYHSLATGLAH